MSTTTADPVVERVTKMESVRMLLLLAMSAELDGDEELARAELERAAERLQGLRT